MKSLEYQQNMVKKEIQKLKLESTILSTKKNIVLKQCELDKLRGYEYTEDQKEYDEYVLKNIDIDNDILDLQILEKEEILKLLRIEQKIEERESDIFKI